MRNRVTKLENVKILVVELLKLCIPIVIGFVVVKTKFLDAGVRDALSRLIARVLFPILMFCIFLNPDISVGQIWDSRYLLLTAVGWVVVSFLIGMAAAKLLKLDRRRGPVFFILLGMSNVTYMGLPLCVALFGERLGQLGVALVSLAGHIAMWTLGVYLMSRYSAEPGKKSFSLKAAFTPVTVAILAAIVLKLVGVRLPDLVYAPLHTLGNVTPQLALVYIGVRHCDFGFFRRLQKPRGPVFLCFKLLLLPLLFGLAVAPGRAAVSVRRTLTGSCSWIGCAARLRHDLAHTPFPESTGTTTTSRASSCLQALPSISRPCPWLCS